MIQLWESQCQFKEKISRVFFWASLAVSYAGEKTYDITNFFY